MIVALLGPKGSGKSTLAAQLTEVGFTQTSFAAPIKMMLRTLLSYQGLSESTILSMLDGDLKEQPTALLCGKSPRFAMQTLGTEWRDLIGRTLWSDAWYIRYDGLFMGRNVVIDDMRFSHEAFKIRSLGGHIILVDRESQRKSDDPHPSETEFTKIKPNFTVKNVENEPRGMYRQLRNYLPGLPPSPHVAA